MTVPNIGRLRQKVGVVGADEESSAQHDGARRVYRGGRMRDGLQGIWGSLRNAWDNLIEALCGPELHGALAGGFAFLITPHEPLVARLFCVTVGYFAGQVLGAMLLMSAAWVKQAMEKHPVLWVLFGVALVFHLLP